MAKYAVYIHDSAREPFTAWILAGEKTIETRNRDTLRQLVGQRVYIVRTGRGPACVVGSCIITYGVYRTAAELDKIRGYTKISKTSKYNPTSAGKYCYTLDGVTACEPIPLKSFQIKKSNRSYCELMEA